MSSVLEYCSEGSAGAFTSASGVVLEIGEDGPGRDQQTRNSRSLPNSMNEGIATKRHKTHKTLL